MKLAVEETIWRLHISSFRLMPPMVDDHHRVSRLALTTSLDWLFCYFKLSATASTFALRAAYLD